MNTTVHHRGGFLTTVPGRIVTAVLIVAAMVTAAAGAGAFGGTPVNDAADGWLGADSTWVAPASAAFRIWSVIYVGLIGYGVWQFFGSAQTRRHRRARPWILAGVVINSLWLWAVQLGWLWLSVVVMLALLATLARLWHQLDQDRPGSRVEALVVDQVTGLYLGWVMIATIANLAAWFGSLGWRGQPLDEAAWAVIVLLVAAALGLALAWRFGGKLAPALAMAWGLVWIAVGRTDGSGPQSMLVAVVAVAAAVVILGGTVVLRIRAHRTT